MMRFVWTACFLSFAISFIGAKLHDAEQRVQHRATQLYDMYTLCLWMCVRVLCIVLLSFSLFSYLQHLQRAEKIIYMVIHILVECGIQQKCAPHIFNEPIKAILNVNHVWTISQRHTTTTKCTGAHSTERY